MRTDNDFFKFRAPAIKPDARIEYDSDAMLQLIQDFGDAAISFAAEFPHLAEEERFELAPVGEFLAQFYAFLGVVLYDIESPQGTCN